MTGNRTTERVDHPPRVREAIDELMREKDAADNRATELESLSKLKMAGRLRYWRGTIEIPESELHAICDEIQAEYDRAVAAMNKAAGNWAKADVFLRERTSGTLTAEQVREAIERHSAWVIGNNRCFRAGAYEEIAAELRSEINRDDERRAR